MSVNVCGLLVDPRPLENVFVLIENFKKIIPNTHLYFFCGNTAKYTFQEKYKNDEYIHLIAMSCDNLTSMEYNDVLKSLNFWNMIPEKYTHVLHIQTDGCLCENSEYKLSDFYHYDYIGGYTPYKWWWKETKGLHNYEDYQCFNGGFSFKNIAAMKKVITTYPPNKSEPFKDGQDFTVFGEDLYFVVGLLKLNKEYNYNYKLPLDEYATNFCTHTHFIKKTFCVHKYDAYVDNNSLKSFLDYCPLFINFTGDKSKLFFKVD